MILSEPAKAQVEVRKHHANFMDTTGGAAAEGCGAPCGVDLIGMVHRTIRLPSPAECAQRLE